MSARRSFVILSALGVLAAAPLFAQSPAAAPRARPQAPAMRGPVANTAQFLLSQSAALDLTDEQVVRLAELARAAEARRQQLRTELQAVRPAERPDTDAERSELRAQLQALRESQREEVRQERETAISILSVQQQSLAWELLASARGRAAAAMRGRLEAPDARGLRGRPAQPRSRVAPPQGR